MPKNLIARFVREEEGQDLVEFLVELIALVAFVGVQVLGQTINTYYGTTHQRLAAVYFVVSARR